MTPTFSRRDRRIMSVLAAMTAFVAAGLLDSEVYVAAGVLFGLAALFFIGLLRATNRLAFRSAKALDERELQLVLRANQQGYLTVLGFIAGALFYNFVSLNPLMFRRSITLEAGEFVFWLASMFLAPTLHLAWTQPDPLEDDLKNGELA